MTEETTPAAAPSSPAKLPQENIWLNLLLNVLLPVTVLSYCSKEPETGKWYALGPVKALIVSVCLPVGYQIYDFIKRRKWNFFSIVGLVSILLTGGLGLLKMDAQAFAWKEASIPLVFGLTVLLSHKIGKPLSRLMMMNPEIMDVDKIERIVAARDQRPAFEKLLWTSTWLLALSFLISAVLNYSLALFFLSGTVPGSTANTEAIGKVTGWGFLVIGLPMIGFLIFAFLHLVKGLKKLTGLDLEEIMLPR